MKYFFCYEQGASGIWSPVLYHGSPPARQQRNATALVAYDSPEEPSFYTLQQLFPIERYIEVVRPVEGFQTKDGKFFDDERSATVHETTFELASEFYKRATLWPAIEPLADKVKDEIIEQGLLFLRENRDVILRYLEATHAVHDVEPETQQSPDPATEAVA